MFSTAPDIVTAKDIGEALVQSGAAACVNIIPGVQSIYRWRGDVCRDEEIILLIKTSDEKIEEVKKTVLAMHPYEVPEVISLNITGGSDKYLSWINDSTRSIKLDVY